MGDRDTKPLTPTLCRPVLDRIEQFEAVYSRFRSWHRSLPLVVAVVDLADSADPVALVTVAGRRVTGDVAVFTDASRDVAMAQSP